MKIEDEFDIIISKGPHLVYLYKEIGILCNKLMIWVKLNKIPC